MPGLKLKYTSNNHQNITYLDEGFIDLTILKIVEVPDLDLGKKSVNLNLVIYIFFCGREPKTGQQRFNYIVKMINIANLGIQFIYEATPL